MCIRDRYVSCLQRTEATRNVISCEFAIQCALSDIDILCKVRIMNYCVGTSVFMTCIVYRAPLMGDIYCFVCYISVCWTTVNLKNTRKCIVYLNWY